MVDLGLEGQRWGFEWVFFWECQGEDENAALEVVVGDVARLVSNEDVTMGRDVPRKVNLWAPPC